jgi:hypothetical protein
MAAGRERKVQGEEHNSFIWERVYGNFRTKPSMEILIVVCLLRFCLSY